jgi:thiol:disulfide interchange protein DsbC
MNKLLVFLALIVSTTVYAADQKTADAELEALRAMLTKQYPELKPEDITRTPINGLMQIISGVNVLYISADGRYLMQGDLIDIPGKTDLTEQVVEGLRVDYLSQVSTDQMIIFSPELPRHTITVFTDIDCFYCQKLHKEIDSYMKQGIAIRYMFFPRAGLGSPAYQKGINVWCADDRNEAMTKAKQGISLPNKQCENPIAAQFMMGQKLGVTGTPVIFTETGMKVPGYVPAAELSKMLNGLEG